MNERAILHGLLDDLWPLTGGMDELDTVFARACREANYWPPRFEAAHDEEIEDAPAG
jgi:hypothetical protein